MMVASSSSGFCLSSWTHCGGVTGEGGRTGEANGVATEAMQLGAQGRDSVCGGGAAGESEGGRRVERRAGGRQVGEGERRARAVGGAGRQGEQQRRAAGRGRRLEPLARGGSVRRKGGRGRSGEEGWSEGWRQAIGRAGQGTNLPFFSLRREGSGFRAQGVHACEGLPAAGRPRVVRRRGRAWPGPACSARACRSCGRPPGTTPWPAWCVGGAREGLGLSAQGMPHACGGAACRTLSNLRSELWCSAIS